MYLYLSKNEKQELINNGKCTVERKCYMGAPASSIMHGIGNKSLFDKIAYKWVYGDTDNYIKTMAKVDRRGTDYIHGQNKDRNIWNGNTWYEFNRTIDEFEPHDRIYKSGHKAPIYYAIDSFTCTLRQKDNSTYFDIILTMNITLKP